MNEVGAHDRPPMNQEEYGAEFGTLEQNEVSILKKVGRKFKDSYCQPFTSWYSFFHTIFGFMPILEWLPKYNVKANIASDIVGGLTTGIMHVPQGIAYSVLAGVDPVYGLYSSCFPAFFYMFFGTSRHVSIGSFAVVALMAGLANDNVMMIRGDGIIEVSFNGTVTTQYSVTPIQVAATLTFAMGIWQILCGLLRLQFLMAYFSDSLVSGFTTGAAVHVLLAQIDDILGIHVPKVSGPGYLFVRIYDIITRLPQSNIATIIVSIISIIFLYSGKTYLSPFLGKKYNLKLPIPYELILVSTSAALSTLLSWHSTHNLEIVGEIPAGLPRPELPVFYILKECLIQSIGISIVTIAIHISMAKMLAKKLNYSVDDNQELYALGFTSILGGCFPVYPVSTALGRTMVNVKSGTKTQLSTIFSCALLMTTILWLGPLLEDLPKCILASIITVALKSMFVKCGELRKLYPVSKTDFAIWVVSFFTTMCIDVMEGLAISILFALFTVICRSQWPRWHFIIYSPKSDNSGNNGKTKIDSISSDISIFRFDGPLLFTNVERFKICLKRTLSEWESTWSAPVYQVLGNSEKVDDKETKISETPRFFIVDCTAMAYVDYMGINALKEIIKEIHDRGVCVYFAGCNASLCQVMVSSGFFDLLSRENIFPTLKDAVAIANRNGDALQMLINAKKNQVFCLRSNSPSGTRTPSPTSPRTSPSSIVRLSLGNSTINVNNKTLT